MQIAQRHLIGSFWRAGIAAICLSFLFTVSMTISLHAQSQAFKASISGSVFDPSGAVIGQNTVTLKSQERGDSRTFTTSAGGHYAFPLVPPGNYSLKVETPGFRSYEQDGIVLAVGQDVKLDVTLQVGAVTEEVKVTAAAPLLNTSNVDVGSEVSEKQAVELPLNWRNIFGLVALDSSVNNSALNQVVSNGVSQGNAEQDITFFNFGGGRFGTVAFLLDGHWNGAGDWDGLLYAPGVDETQEFKIQTNAFSAEYGWSMGNVVNAITKSGSSQFHGTGFEFLRNSALDANNYFNAVNNVAKPLFHRNQFGASVGGPLYIPKLYEQRNKTFIFGVYEGLRQQTPFTLLTTVPSASMKAGDFSSFLGAQIGADYLGRPVYDGQLYDPMTTRRVTDGQVDPSTGLVANGSGYIRDPFPGNILPTNRIDPVASKLLQYWPDPNTTGSFNFIGSAPLPLSMDRYTVRVDHNISDKSMLFARWSQERLFRVQSGTFFGANDPGGPGNKSPNNRWDTALNYTRTFSPSLVMSINLGWNRWVEGGIPQGIGFDATSLGLPASAAIYPAFPYIGVDGVFGLGNGGQAIPREDRTYAIDFTKIHGAHQMNIGFMGVQFALNRNLKIPASFNFSRGMTSGPDPITASQTTGAGFASFLLGTGTGGSISTQAPPAYMKKFYGWYFQDDWKATPKLTLNLGLRYDFQTAPTERYDRLATFNFKDPNPISQSIGFEVPGYLRYVGGSNSRGVYSPQYTNFAPRIGLNYQISNRLVMRSGFGLFYTPAMEMSDYQGISLYGFTQVTPWVATIDGITPVNLLSDPFPNGLIQPVGKANGALTQVGQSVNAINTTRPTPYVEQWSLGLQYKLAENDSFEATYVGNHGVKLLWASVNVNQLPTHYLSMGSSLLTQVPNPFYGNPATSSSACGLDQPTVAQGQLLRPYPQFCDVSDIQQPSSTSSYQALKLTYAHRFSQGLHVLASYTVSKYLDQTSGPESWGAPNSPSIQDNYNLGAERSLDLSDIPKSFVISYVYDLPIGRGKPIGNNMNKAVNAIVGGWQFAGITTFKDGFPLAFTSATNPSNSYGGSPRPNLVGDPKISNPTANRWFNTDAFAQPDPFSLSGTAPRSFGNLRSAGLNNWDINIEKWFLKDEKFRIQFRAEMYNALNHVYFYAPDTVVGDVNFGKVSTAGFARSIQLGLKLYW